MGMVFRGWKPKMSFATLMLACMLMVGWMRSLVILDEVGFISENSYQRLVLMMGAVVWAREQPRPKAGIHDGWSTGPLKAPFRKYPTVKGWDSSYPLDCPMWGIAAGGFAYGKSQTDGYDLRVWIIPYWSLVLPLSLLSAYLLLSKPRPAK